MGLFRFKDWKIRTKLVSIIFLMVMTPLFVAATLSVTKFNASLKSAAEQDLEHIVDGLYRLASAQEEILHQVVDEDLSLARSVLRSYGDAVTPEPGAMARIVPRETSKAEKTPIDLPVWRIGDQRLTGDSTVVDRIRRLSGADSTIFQATADGRLIRVATTVRVAGGGRAVGTYFAPDSAVARTVFRGEVHRGRTFAVNDWYITAYDPLKDAGGAVVGAVAVGVRVSESPTLSHAIKSTVIGETGYPYIIDSGGTLIFHPTRRGENIIDEQDSDGDRFIAQMCREARTLAEDEVGTIRYPWMNPAIGETEPRMKIVKYRYFREWDWIIAAGSYESEIFGAIYETKTYISLVAAFALVLVLVLSLMLSSIFTRPIQALTEATVRMSRGDLEQRFEVDRRDEIGILGESFNRMAEEIRISTVNLERTVEERTHQLAESRERHREMSLLLRDILQASTEYAIIATDPFGTVLQYNTGAENLYGWTADEMVGMRPLSLTFPEDERGEGDFREWMRGRLASAGKLEYVSTRLRKNGSEFTAQATITLIRSPEGEEIGFLEISRDITERLALERQLRETRDFLASVVESSVDVIVTTDQQGRITFINPAVRDVLGFSRDELLGSHISKVYVRGIDQAWDLMEELVCHGLIRNYEMKLFTKDGREVPIMTSAGLLRDEAGMVLGTVGIFTDITERKKLEAKLNEAQQHLVQAVKLKAIGDLVAGVAHEINNPLMAAGAVLHVLLNRGDSLDEDTVSKLKLLEQVNERIAGIVQHLRDFSRQSETSFEPLNLNEAIGHALLITRQQLLNHGIEIETDLADDLPAVRGDLNQLEQVFLNLIANARDAMDEHGGEKRLKLRTFVTRGAWPQAVAEVQDTGGGIPESVLAKIYDPFFSTKEVGKGTGLGLSICHGILEAHGGTIDAKSSPGIGTTFQVAIPSAGPGDEEDGSVDENGG